MNKGCELYTSNLSICYQLVSYSISSEVCKTTDKILTSLPEKLRVSISSYTGNPFKHFLCADRKNLTNIPPKTDSSHSV